MGKNSYGGRGKRYTWIWWVGKPRKILDTYQADGTITWPLHVNTYDWVRFLLAPIRSRPISIRRNRLSTDSEVWHHGAKHVAYGSRRGHEVVEIKIAGRYVDPGLRDVFPYIEINRYSVERGQETSLDVKWIQMIANRSGPLDWTCTYHIFKYKCQGLPRMYNIMQRHNIWVLQFFE